MNLIAFLVALILVLSVAVHRSPAQDFKNRQLKYDRVKNAIAEKEGLIRHIFAQKRLTYPPRQIFIRVFKLEQVLELWVGGAGTEPLALLKEYKICARSGMVGPKRQQGDNQVPEGFYHIDRFNPLSNFHLSLGVDYPNRADRILGLKGRLGGDIFIHGNCVTIGCVPITDEAIKEVYVIAVEAKASGQKSIPIHIFPARLNDKGFSRLARDFGNKPDLIEFWTDLKAGFDFFEKNRRPPGITVDSQGRYQVKAP